MHCVGTMCSAHAMNPSQGGREETTLHLCRHHKGLHILGGWWPWPSAICSEMGSPLNNSHAAMTLAPAPWSMARFQATISPHLWPWMPVIRPMAHSASPRNKPKVLGRFWRRYRATTRYLSCADGPTKQAPLGKGTVLNVEFSERFSWHFSRQHVHYL